VNDPVGQVVITGNDRGSVQVVEHLTYPGLPPVTTHSSQGATLALGYARHAITARADLGQVQIGVPEDAPSGHVINAQAGTGSVTITSG
jgi:hypothetical protein